MALRAGERLMAPGAGTSSAVDTVEADIVQTRARLSETLRAVTGEIQSALNSTAPLPPPRQGDRDAADWMMLTLRMGSRIVTTARSARFSRRTIAVVATVVFGVFAVAGVKRMRAARAQITSAR
jgi:hypothetical protein